MKRIIIVMLTIVLTLSCLTACGSTENSADIQISMNADKPSAYTLPEPSDTVREDFLNCMQAYMDATEELCTYVRQNEDKADHDDVKAQKEVYLDAYTAASDAAEQWGNNNLSDDEILVYQYVSQYVMQTLTMSMM